MCLCWSLMLFALWGAAVCEHFKADINMAGVMGWVEFDSSSKTATVNLTGACKRMNISLNEFPVMYGHFSEPCLESNIGKTIYRFSASQSIDEIDVSDLFEGRTDLADLSVVVEPCSDNNDKACAVVRKRNGNIKTWQAKFFSSVAGDLYIRQNDGEDAARILSDLMSIKKSGGVSEVSLFVVPNESSSCDSLAGLLDSLSLTSLGMLKVGSPQNATKSRLEASQLSTDKRFALIRFGREFGCAEIREVEVKNVVAPINMKHMRGSISFSQASPFDTTEITVSLSNLNSLVGPYHVHQFPVPQRKTSEENLCHNDHVGGHWNPFDVDTTISEYPRAPGATHDMYETGDLSGRHGSMAGQDNFNSTFTDWNLPLFGRNSIVGRSVVIHHPNSSRLLCGTIGYPGNVMTAVAVLKGPVVGRIMFNQLKSNPDSDLTLFLELSYGNSLSPATNNHNWHAHEYPISSETDFDIDVCQSTKGHYNPFKVDTNDTNYYPNCNPDSPFACEVGDFSSKHMAISLTSRVGTVHTKFFFTDTTAGLSGITSVLGRSLVIHGADKAGSRLSCANITAVRSASAQTGPWFGAGSSRGGVQFSQSSYLEPTVIKVSLTDLQSAAGGYHVHILPLRKSSLDRDACSNENILGHFNPFSVNQSLSPPPATGSSDQYEVGDISGKFGLLTTLTQMNEQYVDNNLPLFGPNSIMGRSLVVHYGDGKRMQCADILPDHASEGGWVRAKAVFNNAVKGTISMVQQIFPDGSSSDTILQVDLQSTQSPDVTEAAWYIHTNRLQDNDHTCSGVGDDFNPFKMSIGAGYSTNCSPGHPLSCMVGDMTSKQGPVSLGNRQLLTDANLPLAGDFTVVYRSIVLKSTSGILDCASILPDSPAALLTFLKVNSFSRFEFRSTVASILKVQPWEVTILPGAPSLIYKDKCQQVNFFVSGDINITKTLQHEEKLGKFRQSKLCSPDDPDVPNNANQYVKSRGYLLTLLAVVPQFILSVMLQ
ncbi:hypothetical protein AOXY_G13384 [Acipenser oxyrinchus oxyrinchus]|uniref:Superoxide dismutase copper/zinc binding domain-containing protein n=1 Tax=Acipenser oxyrinchus oxyrinchus TaxID=40147 RepID=A0AAD8DCC9_ACIOX|nr:hypothetical protein AOXY_G13384 [Acipenser oxyrinchus oxyrinchus]